MFYHCLGLLLVVSISAVPLPEELSHDGEIPNCRDGEKPLLAADIGIHTCEKSCPEGFRCEYKARNVMIRKGAVNISRTKGMCCPNLKELEKIYSEDEKLGKAVRNSNA